MVRPRRPISDRFWSKVDVRGPDECWPWRAGMHSAGYGSFTVERGGAWRRVPAHGVAHELTYGTVAPGRWILHSCDNRPCCNPAHLRAGTAQDNAHDALVRRRNVVVTDNPARRPRVRAKMAVAAARRVREKPETFARGERHGSAKLTEADVLDIRSRSAAGERTADLAAERGLSWFTVHQIIKRRNWRHLP